MDVLVADDNEQALSLLASTLIELGYNVTTARDGVAALEAVERNPAIRLAILNWILPGLDGLVVSRQLKVNPIMDVCTIIMVGGRFRDEIQEAFSSWADCYMSKPLGPASIMACVDAAAQSGRSRRAGLRIVRPHVPAPWRKNRMPDPGRSGCFLRNPSLHAGWN